MRELNDFYLLLVVLFGVGSLVAWTIRLCQVMLRALNGEKIAPASSSILK